MEKAVIRQGVESVWQELEAKVDALITRRINLFHDAMVERGQVVQPAKPSDPIEADQSLQGGE